MKETPLIELEAICRIFQTDEIETHALKHINFTVYKGEYVSISGPSGCGKSTLLNLLGLLDPPNSGSYRLNGKLISALNHNQRAQVRNREIGFIFQSFNLISDLTVAENVELPLTYRTELNYHQRNKRVKEVLDKVDMGHRHNHYPSQLSGGQQQRVAFARAIGGSPNLILADEPTGNLDSKNAEKIMSLISRLHQEGTTICMVTHDPRSAYQAQRIVKLFDGHIVDDSITSPEKIIPTISV